jgi:inner membrane protease subunit 1
MEPTIYSDDIIISEHITSKLSKYERGDVVILRSPSNPQMFICKRIIGVPGDKIKINSLQHNIVPRGHIWLEGDNKSNSTDSRSYGPVPQGLVRGRALCRIWPLNSIQMLTSNV